MSTVEGESQTVYEGVDEIKRQSVHLCLHPNWMTLRPTIAVNKFLQISYDGSRWRGSAIASSVWELCLVWRCLNTVGHVAASPFLCVR